MLREITVAAGLLAAALTLPAGKVFAAQSNVQTATTPVPCLGATNGYGDNCGPARLQRYRVSCKEARHILQDRGYYHIEIRSCGGRYHRFVARKFGHAYLIKVSARSGRVVSILRIWA
jgi:hypothetical protein